MFPETAAYSVEEKRLPRTGAEREIDKERQWSRGRKTEKERALTHLEKQFELVHAFF
jgi:hypothetical protein